MQCKYCNKEMPDGTEVCPKCRGAQDPPESEPEQDKAAEIKTGHDKNKR
jgi:hypothetical protein